MSFTTYRMLAPVILPAKQILSSGSGGYMTKGSHVTTSGKLLLKDYKVKRCIMPYEFGQPVSAQPYHFGDASDSGYGIVF